MVTTTEGIGALAENLEKQELEASNGIATPQVYGQLLAIYLYQNDLCNAKFLWKRIPAVIKAANPELGQIWSVGQNMWKKDLPNTYKALNAVTWSENVAEIMSQLQAVVRTRAVNLISQAYSSINLDTVSDMTGLPAEVCATACAEKGWKVESDNKMVYPVKAAPEAAVLTSSEDQLYKLTDFVAFLEN